MYLKPLKAVKRVDTNFWTFDSETESLKGVKFIIGAFYRPDKQEVVYFDTIGAVITYLTDYSLDPINHQRGKYKNIFIHNLTFDIRFFLHWIATHKNEIVITHLAAGSKDLVVELKINDYRFRFIDSYQLTLLGQEKLEEVLLNVNIKTKIDFNRATLADYKRRVSSDVLGLFRCMEKYFNLIHELFAINVNDSKLISLSRLALKIFRTKYLPQPVYNPFCNYNPETRRYVGAKLDIMDTIYKSYFGGRTEVFKRGYTENVECWDVNSLYPSVFPKAYPIGNCWEKVIYSAMELEQVLSNYEGFYQGRIIESYSHIPLLPTKDKENRTIFAYGRKEGVYPFPEIRYGLKKGLLSLDFPCKVILFKKGDFFNGFGEDTYAKRIKFKREGNPLEHPIKIVMNGLYGKFGQRRNQVSIKYLTEQDYYEIMIGSKTREDFITPGSRILAFEEPSQNMGLARIRFEREGIKPFYLPHISSYVTSYARVELHISLVMNKDNLLYCDTDSIWTTGTTVVNKGDELGEWKLEIKANEVAFLALKCYAYQTDKLYIRIKGVSRKMIDSATFKNVADFMKRSTKIIFQEEPRYNTIKSSLIRAGTFLSFSIRTKHISGAYTKRLVNKQGNTFPIATEMTNHDEHRDRIIKVNQ